ncbi:MAG: T9SS type A sorting domain-containing protein [Bacteroidetes bacterium]|nr:T9SS type A sorting domain-containing protein [Bacteroidota bacterium]
MNRFLKILFYFLLPVACCLLPTALVAQPNLILNGSFEDTVCCPSGGGSVSCTPPWFSPTVGSPDYHHQCANATAPNAGVPSDGASGFQYPYTGQAFVGAYTYQAGSNGREYVEYPFPGDSLIQDKKYCIGFYVNPYNTLAPIDALHAVLSKNSISMPISTNLPNTPDIVNPTGNIIDDTLNWTLVSGYYTAQGGEKFITLGNFYPDSMTNLGAGWNPATSVSYYYIDNVFIYDCDSVGGVSEQEAAAVAVAIYPNPATEEFTLETDLKQAGDLTITITDYLGRKVEVLHEKATAGTYRKKIIASLFAKGEYSVTIKTKEGKGVRKIVVQ